MEITTRPLLLAALTFIFSACAQLEPRPELPAESALPVGNDTHLDEVIAPTEAAHPGASAFRLVSDGREAFVLRWFTANKAERSIDVQTYIWHDDTTGLALASRLLAAADRGVHVRLLVDDMDARSKNVGFAAIQAHPNIDVRMFNPFATRKGTVRFVGEAARSFKRINRRMHNKSWVADNRIAMVGGRNLGDEYFGASESVNMEDLEFVMTGPVVRDISASFDDFWNSPVAYPIELLDADSVTDENLQELRAKLAEADADAKTGWYADELRSSDPMQRLLHGDWPVQWSGQYTFVSDDPLKATGTLGEDASNVSKLLFPAMRATESKLTIISPYFVPGEQGAAGLVDVASQQKKVLILTNSLASNDVAAVHGGYSKERKTLLEGGVELWESKPSGGTQVQSSFKGSSGAGLHTKALTIDGARLFVGSYNLDPRSKSLNSEQGVMVDDAVLAKQLEEIFATQTSDANAWKVTLPDGKKLSWTDGTDTFDSDPKASMWRKFQAWFARAFGLESQL